jgi:fructan beta-fructosidase
MKQKENGQGLVEYALLLTLIAAAAMLTLRMYGITVAQAYCNISSLFGLTENCENAYCQDSFTDGPGNWTTDQNNTLPDPRWDFENGQLCTSSSGAIYNTCSQALDTGDYTVNLDLTTLNKGNGYGLFFRSTLINGKVNGYTFQFDPGLNAFVFRKWVDGRELAPFAITKMPGYDWYGESHNIQVKAEGNTFTAYVDGVPILTGTDSTYPNGGAGLRTWDSTSLCTEDFSITPNQP